MKALPRSVRKEEIALNYLKGNIVLINNEDYIACNLGTKFHDSNNLTPKTSHPRLGVCIRATKPWKGRLNLPLPTHKMPFPCLEMTLRPYRNQSFSHTHTE